MWQSFTTYLGTPFLRAWLSPALLLPTGFHASLSGPKAREKMVDRKGIAPSTQMLRASNASMVHAGPKSNVDLNNLAQRRKPR